MVGSFILPAPYAIGSFHIISYAEQLESHFTSICQLSNAQRRVPPSWGRRSAELPVASSHSQASHWLQAVCLGLFSDEVISQAGYGRAPGQNIASSWPISVHIMAKHIVQLCHSAWSDIQTPGGLCEPHWATLSWFQQPALPKGVYTHLLHLQCIMQAIFTQNANMFLISEQCKH